MRTRNTKESRVSTEWESKKDEIMRERLKNNLANAKPKELGMPEFTRLALKTPSWPKVEEELKTLPKRGKNGR